MPTAGVDGARSGRRCCPSLAAPSADSPALLRAARDVVMCARDPAFRAPTPVPAAVMGGDYLTPVWPRVVRNRDLLTATWPIGVGWLAQ
jgi:hypothetical protein